MKIVRCYWKRDGNLCQADVDNHVDEPFESYGEVVEFVKSNLSVGSDTHKFAVMVVVNV